MDLLKKMNLDGTMAKNRPVPPPRSSKDVMVSSITATVDTTPQLLRPVRPFVDAISPAPASLSNNARFVMDGLLSCFRKNQFVKEGPVDDVFEGFHVSYPNDLERVAFGLVDLKRAGYVRFIAPDGNEVDENCTSLGKCWLAYTQKLLDHVYGG